MGEAKPIAPDGGIPQPPNQMHAELDGEQAQINAGLIKVPPREPDPIERQPRPGHNPALDNPKAAAAFLAGGGVVDETDLIEDPTPEQAGRAAINAAPDPEPAPAVGSHPGTYSPPPEPEEAPISEIPQPEPEPPKGPFVGQFVIYRTEGNSDVPALITTTSVTQSTEFAQAGVPELTDEHHLHLTIFSPIETGPRYDVPSALGRGGIEAPAPNTWRFG